MNFRFPFWNYPFNYQYYNYYKRNYNNYIRDNKKDEKNITSIKNVSDIKFLPTNNEQAIFEIFGIKLYMDDLIILALLLFLYQENVHDEVLYIILFLLLFS